MDWFLPKKDVQKLKKKFSPEKVEVYCALGSNYVLRASPNLVDWTDLLNFSGTNWPMHVVDPGATNYGRRFYRAVLQ